MKITALMKVWSGTEWLPASISSIYNFVYRIVLLTSDISWIGGRGNPSIGTIEDLQKNHDPLKKIIHINYDEPNQIKHCQFAYKFIKKNIPETDYIQLIDSDELWDRKNYQKAIYHLQRNPGFNALRTRMFTYIKSPFYRVDPPEPLNPVCFISLKRPDMGTEPRGCAINPFTIMTDVWCHHFVFVRAHFNHMLEKLIQSHVSEKQPYENMSKWIPEVWNKLPNIPFSWTNQRGGFHPAIGYGKNWKSIKKITIEDLPEILKLEKYQEILNYGN